MIKVFEGQQRLAVRKTQSLLAIIQLPLLRTPPCSLCLRLPARTCGCSQVLIPRKVFVCKRDGVEVPFKYLCWLCYRLQLKRDLYFLGETDAVADGEGG